MLKNIKADPVAATRATLKWSMTIVTATLSAFIAVNAYFVPRAVFAEQLIQVQSRLNVSLIDTQLQVNRVNQRDVVRQIDRLEARRDKGVISPEERQHLAELRNELSDLQGEALLLKQTKKEIQAEAAKVK